jgi:hypothetical protein
VRPLQKAYRHRKAARIIRVAYGIDRSTAPRRVVRYELLGDDVALAIVEDRRTGSTLYKLARGMPDGRAKQLRKMSRAGFTTLKEHFAYYDMLYAAFGAPE